MTAEMAIGDVETVVHQVPVTDPLALPMLAQLAREYFDRYGDSSEIDRYPPQEFLPSHGALLILTRRDNPVAGGAFRRYDDNTAELKRIWTDTAHRRAGLGRRVVGELEQVARRYGYHRLYLARAVHGVGVRHGW